MELKVKENGIICAFVSSFYRICAIFLYRAPEQPLRGLYSAKICIARLKETLYQRGIFKSALMRKPVLPLDQEEKDWVAEGIKKSGLGIVDMTQFQ